MTEPITVVIPVGPSEANRRWLPEAIDSVYRQTVMARLVLAIDYGGPTVIADLRYEDLLWRAPWRSGVAHMFNFGVGIARTELVFMLGSDDYLEPDCLEQCIAAYLRNGRRDAYYYVGVHYLDGQGEQTLPCGAAMVTKGLWEQTGGFPPEVATGASDAAFISMCLVHRPDALIPVNPDKSLYNYRTHSGSDTSQRGPWQGIILETRDLLTRLGFEGRGIR